MIPKPKQLSASARAQSDTSAFQTSPPYSPPQQQSRGGGGGGASSGSSGGGTAMSNKAGTNEYDSLLLPRGGGGSGGGTAAGGTSAGGGDLKGFGSSGNLVKSARFAPDALDAGSVSDSGALPHGASRSKFKRTRRALHLKASDRERLHLKQRSLTIDDDGEETDAGGVAIGDRTPSSKEVEVSEAKKFHRVATYCTCENYDLSEVIEHFERSQFKGSLTLYTDVLYIKQKRRQFDIFVFSYGCITFWNVPPEEEEAILKTLRPFETGSVENRELEEFDFAYGAKSSVRNDEITLESNSALEKLSVAFAIAQCCKLSIFEERIQKEIDRNKHLPEALSRDGMIHLSQREITMEIGRLFIERNSVNLHFDILDTPEFFWEQDKYKPVYDRLAGYLELGKRVDILNKRLDIMKELFEMLNDQMDSMHASKLEWIVIWLIVIEVVISVVWQILIKDILQLFPPSD